ncbi:hypothetical protein [Deinococcus ficus]|uniref:hypothetical protein n=1 Tax=Deinococcus ficus TaxID=317577 RepID=UPI00131D2BCC|nr:hypothetical protein [Deinococcus ficus]
MSEANETQVETKVVETEVVTETEVKDTESKETEGKKDPKVEQLERDNFKQREEIRDYKAKIDKLTEDITNLTESFKTVKETLDAKQEAEAKAEKEKTLTQALDAAGIVDEKARKLATTLLKDSTNYEQDIKAVVEEYPFMTGKKKVVLPDTGKATESTEALPENRKLAVGLSKLIPQ